MKLSTILKEKPEKKYFQLSVSKYKTFKECKAKYQFCYIQRLPRKERDYHVFGKFLHRVLEVFHQEKLKNEEMVNNLLMSFSFKTAYEEYKEKLTEEQFKESKGILFQYLKKLELQKSLNQAPQILSLEKEFFINIDNKILLNGFIDRVQLDTDGIIHVADYKTSSLIDKNSPETPYRKSKKYKRYSKDVFQLKTYAYAMFLENPDLEKVRASFILLRHNFDDIVVEFTKKDAQEIEDAYLEEFEEIQGEKLFRPKTSPLCEYCDFLDECEAGREFVGKVDPTFGETTW